MRKHRGRERRGLKMGGAWGLAMMVLAANGESTLLAQAVSQRGAMITKTGQVSYERPPTPPRPAREREGLDYGDRLETAELSWAVVEFLDLSKIKVRELSRLEIVTPTELSRRSTFRLERGAVYVSDLPRMRELGVQTPHGTIKPKGTEFVIEVSEQETRLILFDGVAELENEHGAVIVRPGEQGTAIAGQPPQSARLEARNVVQWWLYYPAVLSLDDLPFSAAERSRLQTSLDAYRSGALLEALRQFPGYPASPVLNSDPTRAYYAGLLLMVGAVEKSERILDDLPKTVPAARALRRLIDAVTQREHPKETPSSASEWLGLSYAHQANHRLEEALGAARRAISLSPGFAFGWVRVAELEFSFGRTTLARQALARGLELSPENAHAMVLEGFLLSAESRLARAEVAFDQAIAMDPGLGNAWLGRGLVRIRLGNASAGLDDLSTAAVLEPNRSLLHSYLAKAYGQSGEPEQARKELDFARALDPNDPTPLLYSGLLRQERNQINQAVEDLTESLALNDHRAVYRSRLLLDQDRAVRGANLASIYRDAGLLDSGMQAASRAISADYANFSAHLFLANSYSDLLSYNPQVNLRYETPRVSEYLIASLLAPVDAGVLSPTVSQQEYSKLFSRDRIGVTSATEYLSRGAWTESAAFWGTMRNFSFSLDAYYQSDPGQRPNNDLELASVSARVKQQLTPKDSVFLQVFGSEARYGDLAQYYDPENPLTGSSRTIRSQEEQKPITLAGYHRQWSPQHQTLLLASHLNNELQVDNPLQSSLLLVRTTTNTPVVAALPMPVLETAYRSDLEIYSIEAQQIYRREDAGVTVGGRYQGGTFATRNTNRVADFDVPALGETVEAEWFYNPPQFGESDFERITGYAYGDWKILPALQLVAGVAYDRLTRPENFRFAPVSLDETTTEQFSPKGGVVLTPGPETTLRAAYSESLGGASIDQSFRLEPTQVAGFNQAWRSLVPESVTGANAGERFATWAAALEHRFPTRTYAVISGEWLGSDASRRVGTYDVQPAGPVSANPIAFQSTTRQQLDFEERTFVVALNQLLGSEWATGIRYRLSDAALSLRHPGVPATATQLGGFERAEDWEATLHQASWYLLYNHPCGLFSQFSSLWSAQSNRGYTPQIPGDEFWQFNLHVGYRFARRQAEVRLGLLNLTDTDYQLNPLNLTSELPRERTLTASLRFSF